jgi:hypothetical protein
VPGEYTRSPDIMCAPGDVIYSGPERAVAAERE